MECGDKLKPHLVMSGLHRPKIKGRLVCVWPPSHFTAKKMISVCATFPCCCCVWRSCAHTMRKRVRRRAYKITWRSMTWTDAGISACWRFQAHGHARCFVRVLAQVLDMHGELCMCFETSEHKHKSEVSCIVACIAYQDTFSTMNHVCVHTQYESCIHSHARPCMWKCLFVYMCISHACLHRYVHVIPPVWPRSLANCVWSCPCSLIHTCS